MSDVTANIPEAMLKAKRWLVWQSVTKRGRPKPVKIPFYTSGKKRGEKIDLDCKEDVEHLATIEEAQAAMKTGKYSGLGFALGSDGTGNIWQGVDLDSIDEHGLQELAQNLPGYVETSPSGNGVHSIGYGRSFKTLGSNGTGVEAYSSKRYFTVTGEYLRGDLECIAEHVELKLVPIHSPTFHRDTESQSSQESQESQELQIYRQGEGAKEREANTFPYEFPQNCHPQKKGHRNRILFNLARHLKTHHPDSKAIDHKSIIETWHREHLPVIGTKAWAETWSDFRNAWNKVKFLEGEGLLNQAFEAIDMTKPIPQHLQQLGYDEDLFKVAELCRLLAMNSPDRETFFLGNRPLASLIGVSQPSAGNILNMLVEDGILEVVQIGKLEKGKLPSATTYRYLGIVA